MKDKVIRKLFLGFISVHILHHAKEEAFFGLWMIEELEHHGYSLSPGTLYPILHSMEKDGLLDSEERKVNGKIRKYYKITALGEEVLTQLKAKIKELSKEVK